MIQTSDKKIYWLIWKEEPTRCDENEIGPFTFEEAKRYALDKFDIWSEMSGECYGVSICPYVDGVPDYDAIHTFSY